jgi:hypothetical protein
MTADSARAAKRSSLSPSVNRHIMSTSGSRSDLLAEHRGRQLTSLSRSANARPDQMSSAGSAGPMLPYDARLRARPLSASRKVEVTGATVSIASAVPAGGDGPRRVLARSDRRRRSAHQHRGRFRKTATQCLSKIGSRGQGFDRRPRPWRGDAIVSPGRGDHRHRRDKGGRRGSMVPAGGDVIDGGTEPVKVEPIATPSARRAGAVEGRWQAALTSPLSRKRATRRPKPGLSTSGA